MRKMAAALCPAAVALCGALWAQVFTSRVRLVEVYASVQDSSGKPVDGLPQERFQVLDNGQVQPIFSFEPVSGEITCALLLDTTGSMRDALAGVKNAAGELLDEMRAGDSAAVYSFTTRLDKLQDYTQDKELARRSLQRLRAQGGTALYDAVAQVATEISERPGKKAIVLFTDGADNASSLRAEAASQRAFTAGVPIFAVAEGEALSDHKLLERLQGLAEKTGGVCHKARTAKDIGKVFEAIQGELKHLYMLSYKPPQGADETHWRAIEIRVAGKGYQVRGKTGYFPN